LHRLWPFSLLGDRKYAQTLAARPTSSNRSHLYLDKQLEQQKPFERWKEAFTVKFRIDTKATKVLNLALFVAETATNAISATTNAPEITGAVDRHWIRSLMIEQVRN